MSEFFFADPVEEIEIECTSCDGSGWIEGAPYSYNHHTGEPICNYYCCACEGRPVFVQCEPIGLAELLEIDAEMADSA